MIDSSRLFPTIMDREMSTEDRPWPGFQGALGHTIRVWRTDRGLTQQELAERAGISRSYLNQLEKGSRGASRSGVSTEVIARIGQALGVEPSALLAAARAREERSDSAAAAHYPEPQANLLSASATAGAIRPPSERLSGVWKKGGAPQPEAEADRARIRALREFEMLLPYLSPDDLDIVLAMMRRLARG
jgi:transcriptional regulator with XRE-family HTH domain